MNKYFLRIISLVLIPALVGQTSLAEGCRGSEWNSHSLTVLSSGVFTSEALSGRGRFEPTPSSIPSLTGLITAEQDQMTTVVARPRRRPRNFLAVVVLGVAAALGAWAQSNHAVLLSHPLPDDLRQEELENLRGWASVAHAYGASLPEDLKKRLTNALETLAIEETQRLGARDSDWKEMAILLETNALAVERYRKSPDPIATEAHRQVIEELNRKFLLARGWQAVADLESNGGFLLWRITGSTRVDLLQNFGGFSPKTVQVWREYLENLFPSLEPELPTSEPEPPDKSTIILNSADIFSQTNHLMEVLDPNSKFSQNLPEEDRQILLDGMVLDGLVEPDPAHPGTYRMLRDIGHAVERAKIFSEVARMLASDLGKPGDKSIPETCGALEYFLNGGMEYTHLAIDSRAADVDSDERDLIALAELALAADQPELAEDIEAGDFNAIDKVRELMRQRGRREFELAAQNALQDLTKDHPIPRLWTLVFPQDGKVQRILLWILPIGLALLGSAFTGWRYWRSMRTPNARAMDRNVLTTEVAGVLSIGVLARILLTHDTWVLDFPTFFYFHPLVVVAEIGLLALIVIRIARSLLLRRPVRQPTPSTHVSRRERRQAREDRRRRPKTLGPREDIGSLEYSDIARGFAGHEDFNVELDLSSMAAKRAISINDGPSAALAAVVDSSLGQLERIRDARDTPKPLKDHIRHLFNKPDNWIRTSEGSPPILIRVSSTLGVNAARYFNPNTQQVEILLSADFAEALIRAGEEHAEAVRWILMERLFHELGHSNKSESIKLERREESRQMGWDLHLYEYTRGRAIQKAISAYVATNPGFRSGYYFDKVLEPLTETPLMRLRSGRIKDYLETHMPNNRPVDFVKAIGGQEKATAQTLAALPAPVRQIAHATEWVHVFPSDTAGLVIRVVLTVLMLIASYVTLRRFLTAYRAWRQAVSQVSLVRSRQQKPFKAAANKKGWIVSIWFFAFLIPLGLALAPWMFRTTPSPARSAPMVVTPPAKTSVAPSEIIYEHRALDPGDLKELSDFVTSAITDLQHRLKSAGITEHPVLTSLRNIQQFDSTKDTVGLITIHGRPDAIPVAAMRTALDEKMNTVQITFFWNPVVGRSLLFMVKQTPFFRELAIWLLVKEGALYSDGLKRPYMYFSQLKEQSVFDRQRFKLGDEASHRLLKAILYKMVEQEAVGYRRAFDFYDHWWAPGVPRDFRMLLSEENRPLFMLNNAFSEYRNALEGKQGDARERSMKQLILNSEIKSNEPQFYQAIQDALAWEQRHPEVPWTHSSFPGLEFLLDPQNALPVPLPRAEITLPGNPYLNQSA